MSTTELIFNVKKVHNIIKCSNIETSCSLYKIKAPNLVEAVLKVMDELTTSSFVVNMRIDIEAKKIY